MAFPNITRSALWKKAVNKSSSRDDDVSYKSLLEAFSKRVMPELRQINELFNEYTPHDDKHIENLFSITEKVIGHKGKLNLNHGEAFLLSAALLGHDWGMAISTPEKNLILEGKSGRVTSIDNSSESSILALLPDENECLSKHCKDLNIEPNDLYLNDHKPSWRDYVRKTHAKRSGTRIRDYFSLQGTPELGDIVATICEAHALDIEHISDTHNYPLGRCIRDDVINVQAISLYLSLIDLFDICQNRTPYELWKFVSPTDPRSVAEWQKHRALDPIYVDGEALKFRGTAKTVEIWTELLNLREYCENHFSQTRDLLISRSPKNYHLPIKWLDWNDVLPVEGLEPERIRFDFDRSKIFQLLGEKIYEGDPLVFLRELLQNSIDAMRTRKELLAKTPTPFAEHAEITITSLIDAKGEQTISVKDKGIGMDRLTIINYLAKAGKSYYRSEAFEKLGLAFDPISRFGIGILSCFAVSKRIVIETRADAACFPEERAAWKIEINGEEGYWAIYKLTEKLPEFGTTIHVHMDKNKVSAISQSDKNKPSIFRITNCSGQIKVGEYIKAIAGFVEFPIVLEEPEIKTLVVHPGATKKNELQAQHGADECYYLDLEYPIDHAFVAQDVRDAKELLKIEKFDLTNLSLDGLEGNLAMLVPKRSVRVSSDKSWNRYLAISSDGQQRPLRLNQNLLGRNPNTLSLSGPTRSSKRDRIFSVYRDGILIPEEKLPKCLEGTRGYYGDGTFSYPLLLVNLTGSSKQCSNLPSISRTGFEEESSDWAEPILRSYSDLVAKKQVSQLLKMAPPDRFEEIERLFRYYRVNLNQLCEALTLDEWPIALLEAPGRINFRLWKDLKDSRAIPMTPKLVNQTCTNRVMDFFKNREDKKLECELFHWSGEPSLIEFSSRIHGESAMGPVNKTPLLFLKLKKRVNLITPPLYPLPPVQQDFFNNQTSTTNRAERMNNIMQRISENNSATKAGLSHQDFSEIATYAMRFDDFMDRFENVITNKLPRSFAQHLFVASGRINSEHPFGRILFQLTERVLKEIIQLNVPKESIGRLEDLYNDAVNFSRFPDPYRLNPVDIDDISTRLRRLITELNHVAHLCKPDEIKDLEITAKDFLPGTFLYTKDGKSVTPLSFDYDNFPWDQLKRDGWIELSDFGKVINEGSSWPPVTPEV